jgi:hypothetical protein
MHDSWRIAFGVTIVIASVVAFLISWNISLLTWPW